jgi:WhiB family redox-sensing transcriptional regulator
VGLHIFLTSFTGPFHPPCGYFLQVSGLGRFFRTPPRREPAGAEPPPEHSIRTAKRNRLRAVQEIPDDYAWMLEGRCRGADTREFFPSNGLGVEAAQQICRECPVKEPCLEYALQNHIEQGVWGGASERERRRILRSRRRAAALQN